MLGTKLASINTLQALTPETLILKDDWVGGYTVQCYPGPV